MGKASRFFKSLLGFKTTDSSPSSSSEPPHKQQQLKRRWSFGKSRRGSPFSVHRHNASKSIDVTELYHHHNSYKNHEDSNNHAIALAAAVVDAAEVVRMTGRTIGYGVRHELAAVKIQSCFRAYLARRALRALKALVKLQAVVRGHILRKRTADMMRRLQALIRAQARARVLRSCSTTKPSSHFHHHGPPTLEKIEHFPHTKHDHRSMSKVLLASTQVKFIMSRARNNSSKLYRRGITGQEDKIVEMDTWKSHVTTKGRKFFQTNQISSLWHSHSLTTSRGSTLQPTSSSPCASCESNFFYASLGGGVSTPVKSDGSKSCFSSYSDHPNYMANTQSSRAKVRSLSAPRLRPRFEVSNATKRDLGDKYVSGMQRVPTLRDSFAKKVYPGSGPLDQLGLPICDMESEFCVGYWN